MHLGVATASVLLPHGMAWPGRCMVPPASSLPRFVEDGTVGIYMCNRQNCTIECMGKDFDYSLGL